MYTAVRTVLRDVSSFSPPTVNCVLLQSKTLAVNVIRSFINYISSACNFVNIESDKMPLK